MNTSPDMPSSRPMTLSQQLYTQFEQHGLPVGFLSNPKHWQYFNDSLDEAMKLIETYSQEIAREAHNRNFRLKADLAYMAGVYEGMAGKPHPYIVKNYPELSSPDTKAAGNDLPSSDVQSQDKGSLRRKGQLTQKPAEGAECFYCRTNVAHSEDMHGQSLRDAAPIEKETT